MFNLRPITDWSAMGIGEYKNSPFTVTYSQALELLYRELDYLGVEHATVELDITPEQLKLNGELRANQRPAKPCVRLLFTTSLHGDLVYETDEFVKPSWRSKGMQADWQHNLYAIAKGLEGLRMLDRYGITRGTRQYSGFKALNAGRAMPASSMTLTEAWDVIGEYVDVFEATGTAAALKAAKVATHPDKHSGDHTAWNRVAEAAALIERSGS